MKVGFTGSRKGMTAEQVLAVGDLLAGAEVLHHGDCVGADEEAHRLALLFTIPVVLHPPTEWKARAFCGQATEVREAAPYIIRNHHIVDEVDLLIAAPAQAQEVLRSGTWATVRYARKRGIGVIVVLPQGAVGVEEGAGHE